MKPSRHTPLSYQARLKGGGRGTLWRLARMCRQDRAGRWREPEPAQAPRERPETWLHIDWSRVINWGRWR